MSVFMYRGGQVLAVLIVILMAMWFMVLILQTGRYMMKLSAKIREEQAERGNTRSIPWSDLKIPPPFR